MDWILSKMSLPDSWEKAFPTEKAALAHLRTVVCDKCLKEAGDDDHELRTTSCGCEFWIYQDDQPKQD